MSLHSFLIRRALPCLLPAILLCAILLTGRGKEEPHQPSSAASPQDHPQDRKKSASRSSSGSPSTADLTEDPRHMSADRFRVSPDPAAASRRQSTTDTPTAGRAQDAAAPHGTHTSTVSSAQDGGPAAGVPAESIELAPLPIVSQLQPSGSGDDAIIAEQQRRFAEDMQGAEQLGVDTPEYLKRWNRAQWDADNRLRQELGAIGFNRLAAEAMGAQQAGK